MAIVKLERRAGFPALLVASVIGVYALVMLGATTAVTDALATCTTWPTCDGRWFVHPDDPAAVAWTHRAVALLVGLLVTITVVLGWLEEESKRIRGALGLAFALYLVQILVGAMTALGAASVVLSNLHLLLAMIIFGSLVLSLAWTLERQFPGEEERLPETELEPAEPDGPPPNTWPNVVRAYVSLTKPRLMWLLCLVAAAGMALAAGSALRISTIVATLGAGVLAIGASGTYNHVLERDVDRRMARTADRPLPSELVPVRHALIFGTTLGIASIAIFVYFLNPVAAALGLAAIVFYSVIYTLILKPHTVQNTVIGGAAGALPALIGWAAVTGTIELPAVLLAAVIFWWTPAHFYNLAIAYREDYARGGFPMLPVVHGERVARKHVLLYAGITMLTAAGLAATSRLSWVFSMTAVLAGAGFLVAIYVLHHQRTRTAALQTFHTSNAYLGAILLVVIVDGLAL